jgi:hypothetical protein
MKYSAKFLKKPISLLLNNLQTLWSASLKIVHHRINCASLSVLFRVAKYVINGFYYTISKFIVFCILFRLGVCYGYGYDRWAIGTGTDRIL